MASSRRRVFVGIGIAAMLAGAAACDSLIGLGKYSMVPEDSGAADSMGGTSSDAASENDSTMLLPEAAPLDAGDAGDAGDASDVTVDDAPTDAEPPPDVSIDAPSLVTLWAQWPMPNPDAAIAPGSSALLPNQMAYDLGADGGSLTAYDAVTQLTWLRSASAVTSPFTESQAASYCFNKGFGVPTRIQLVSLIDFTQVPTINATAFLGVSDRLCTSSQVNEDGGWNGKYWTIDFNTGLTSTTAPCTQVLCVEGP